MKIGSEVRIKEGVTGAHALANLYGVIVGSHPIGKGPVWFFDVRVKGMDSEDMYRYGTDVLSFRPSELVEAIVESKPKYVRIKRNIYDRWIGQVGRIVKPTTFVPNGFTTVEIDGNRVILSNTEIDPIDGTPMDVLFTYAQSQGFQSERRRDGSFYVRKNGREIYSVIYDRFSDTTFETWNYTRGMRGVHFGRNVESVKRSLRRLRVRTEVNT